VEHRRDHKQRRTSAPTRTYHAMRPVNRQAGEPLLCGHHSEAELRRIKQLGAEPRDQIRPDSDAVQIFSAARHSESTDIPGFLSAHKGIDIPDLLPFTLREYGYSRLFFPLTKTQTFPAFSVYTPKARIFPAFFLLMRHGYSRPLSDSYFETAQKFPAFRS